MSQQTLDEIMKGLASGEVVPYIGPGALRAVTEKATGTPMPADSDSLILAMTGGQPMSPRLMYEFPRAAMHMENKKGRSFLERFLNGIYKERAWLPSELHTWIASQHLPYVIDCNRDTLLQQLYADRNHTLVVGAARITGTHYRFNIYQFENGEYRRIEQDAINPALPLLFKPLGTPMPSPSYIASDADFVDYITELMGGFAIPGPLKQYRNGKRYLFLGMRFTRDTERMVMSDIIYGAASPAGWALIPDASDKEMRFCARKDIQLLQADWLDLLHGSLPVAARVA